MAGYSRGRNVVAAGVVVIASVAMFIALFAVMTGRSLRQKRSDLFVALSTAPGLVKGDAVLLRGVAIGEVRSLDFDDVGQVIIHVRLSRPVRLDRGTSAILAPVDMFGRQSLVLQPGSDEEMLADGDTIGGSAPPGLTARIAALTDQANAILGDSTARLIHDLLEGGRAAVGGVEDAAVQLDDVLRHADRVLTSEANRLEGVLREAERVGSNLGAVSDSVELARIRDSLGQSAAALVGLIERLDSTTAGLGEVIEALNHGEGSAGLLLHDPRLYENATAAFARLDALMADIRSNPGRYIRLSIF